MRALGCAFVVCALAAVPATTTAAPITFDASTGFVSGPGPQSATSTWPYFRVNDARTSATLLSLWDTDGNEVVPGNAQWDDGIDGLGAYTGGSGNGNYPFVQRMFSDVTGGFGSGLFADGDLYLHPGNRPTWALPSAGTITSVPTPSSASPAS